MIVDNTKAPLEQSRCQVHRLALHQQTGINRTGMPRPNHQRADPSGCRRQSNQPDAWRQK